MFQFISKLFNPSSEKTSEDGFLQAEREALIDVILLAMYADNHLAIEEQEFFEAQKGRLNWNSQVDPELFVHDQTAKVRRAHEDPEAREQMLHSIRERLYSEKSVRHAYDICKEMLLSDGIQTDDETIFLETVRLYLGVEADAPK